MRAPNQTPSQTHPKVLPDPPQIPAAVLLGFRSGSTGHNPVIRPPCELIPLAPHLLVKGSEQDIAQQGRDDPALRGSPWSLIPTALVFVTRRERLPNELQHPAVGDLLPDQGHELFVVPRTQNSLLDPRRRS